MVHFRKIHPTKHYLDEHPSEVPWEKVVELILAAKDPRKKGNVYHITKEKYYILFRIDNCVLYVINAKRK